MDDVPLSVVVVLVELEVVLLLLLVLCVSVGNMQQFLAIHGIDEVLIYSDYIVI